jgi:hypothetical protein
MEYPMSDIATNPSRSLPPRPATGLLAWQATLGHISTHHSPDAVLKLETFSREARVFWSASVSWGSVREAVSEQATMAAALRELWHEVSKNHSLFERLEDATKAPQFYDDTEWLDMPTQESLQRVIWVTQIAFPGQWTLITLYQPIENPQTRVQMRLLAKGDTVAVGGRGASVVDACRALFRNATPYYAAQSKDSAGTSA